MTDRIRTLVKLIADTRPVQSARRQSLIGELRALRSDLDPQQAQTHLHSLDAAILLMEFMNRSDEVATAETIQTVAHLVGTIEEESLRPSPARLRSLAPQPAAADVHEHRDLRLTQEFLLGSILVQAGVLSQDSLARGLHLHTSSGQPLGQCLVQLGAASREQIAAAVAYQESLRETEPTSAPVARGPRPIARAAATPPTPVAPPPVTPRVAARPADPAGLALRLTSKQRGVVQSIHSQVLGEILVRLGSITREQLERALHVQRAACIHIGEALVENGATTWDQIKRALDVQRQLRRAA